MRVRAVNDLRLLAADEEDYNWSAEETGTPAPDPSVAGITVKERSQTSATLTVSIDHGKDTGHTVHLRHREKGTTLWTNADDEPSSNDIAEFDLTNLKAGTTYEVLAWLDDDSAPPASDAEAFYTSPVVEGITFSDRTRVSAKATVSLTISNIDDSSHTVHLRYREKDATPEANWIDADDEPASNGSAEFTLSGLDGGTTYEVQSWLDDDPPPTDSETFEFYTLPEVTAVSVSDEGQVSAKITVSLVISDIDTSSYAIHVRTSPPGEGKAFTPPPNSLEFTLPGLKSDTDYRVEAWTEDDFDNVTAPFDTFKTLRPTVSNVEVEDSKEQESATATVTIDEPNGEDQQVFLRYRPATQQDWSTTELDAGEITDVTSNTDTASVLIENLKSDTLYEIEASLESDYSASETTNFTTAKPSLTRITVSDEEQTKATATISIHAPNGDSLEIYVQYRKVTNPDNEDWKRADDTSSIDETATASLAGLTSGTQYEAQASLDQNFPDTEGVTVTSLPFTTDPPSLKGLEVMGTKLTEATIKATIKAPNDQTQTVHLQYREEDATPEAEWSTPPIEADVPEEPEDPNDTVAITLSELTSGIAYEVRASLNISPADPSATVLTAIFTTTTPDPSISGVSIGGETQTTAVATVTIALPGTGTNTAHVRYQALGATAWSTQIFEGDATRATATVNITGLDTDTNYQAQVSLSNTFTNPWEVPFETIPYPSVKSVAVTDFDKTTAEVTVAINDEDGVSREVHLRYIVYSENPDWTNDGITTKTDDNGADTATKDLEDLSPGTTYILEASYDTNFVTGVAETEFTTKSNPSVGSVKADTVTKTTALVVIDIAHHDDTELTVELRYQVKADPQDWTNSLNVRTAQAISSDSSENPVNKLMEGLAPGTEYVLHASLDSNFPDDATKEDTFTTKRLPSILSVRVGNKGRDFCESDNHHRQPGRHRAERQTTVSRERCDSGGGMDYTPCLTWDDSVLDRTD